MAWCGTRNAAVSQRESLLSFAVPGQHPPWNARANCDARAKASSGPKMRFTRSSQAIRSLTRRHGSAADARIRSAAAVAPPTGLIIEALPTRNLGKRYRIPGSADAAGLAAVT
jgi:hypothetical protein